MFNNIKKSAENKEDKNEKQVHYNEKQAEKNQKDLSPDRLTTIAPPPSVVADFEQRIAKLESKGRKRGRRNMVIGIAGSFAIALAVMYIGYCFLIDVIDIAGRTGESAVNISDYSHSNKERENNVNRGAACSKDAKTCPDGSIVVRVLPDCEFADCLPAEDKNNSDISAPTSKEQLMKDSDNDGLLDSEEIKYGADLNNPDTDGDGYLDGDEVKNGFNPIGKGRL